MKKFFAALLALSMTATFLFGCAGQDAEDGKTGWAKVESAGKLVVGLDDTFAPMGFRDADGNLVGFDVDMAKAMGEVLGVEIELQPINWKAKEQQLASGRVDCLWNGLSVTPERLEQLSMTKKYLNNRLIVMTLRDDVQVTSAEDLANYNVGIQAGSSALEIVEQHEAYPTFQSKLKQYDTYDQVILDLQTGRLDCMVVDEVLGEYKSSQMEQKLITCEFNFGDDFYAVGCRKEDTDLAEKLNEGFAKLIENGKAEEISMKWFGRNAVILED